MRARLLGWAGVQVGDGETSIVIDPLQDPAAVWAAAGDLAKSVPMPELVTAEGPKAALGLVTHLHRDHADAAALAEALAPGAPVLTPAPFSGSDGEETALRQAFAELADAGLPVRTVAPWETVGLDGWTITALPAADGTGDPQVSWMVQRDGATVVHGGDTLMHGWWWRIAERAGGPIDVAFLPINGPRLTFPHRRPASPLPGAMTGADAAIAAMLLRARRLVPIHYGAYHFPPVYVPDADALGTLRGAADEHGVTVETPALGAWFDVAAPVAA